MAGPRLLQALLPVLALAAACADAPPARDAGPPEGATWSAHDLSFFTDQPPDPDVRHVHLMHLDGFHSGLFERLLAEGMLPHFDLLLARGRHSTVASTVDKSETFKVIQAYLTSRLDTRITGWWQFSREELRFRNFWLDPVEVANYALGLEFPLHPTVFDTVAARGGNTAAGFSLHRRSVPFQNYSRNYLEGALATFKHTYFTQAHASMGSFLAVLERIARNEDEALPAFSMSLLAVADEFGHLDGLVRRKAVVDPANACFDRKSRAEREEDPIEEVFRVLDEDEAGTRSLRRLYRRGLTASEVVAGRASGPFTRVERAEGEIRRFCIRIPGFQTAAGPGETPTLEYAAPRVVLGMIAVDFEVGRLIDRLRAIRWRNGRTVFETGAGNGIAAYVEAGQSEDSLFEKTLFIFTGDHGLVDTSRKMAPPDPEHSDPHRHRDSLDVAFVEYLNGRLGLVTPTRDAAIGPGIEIGIDDEHRPAQLALPHLDPSWQDAGVRRLVAAAEQWAGEFFGEIKDVLRSELYAKYWWLLFLRRLLVDPRLDGTLEPYRDTAVDLLAALYLQGEPAYQSAWRRAGPRFYDGHVRLVYGGGARNNAEIFLPTQRSGTPSWDQRPGFEEIVHGQGAPLLAALQDLPAVGLIFVREANASLAADRPLPSSLAIRVLDRAGNAGIITVQREAGTGVLLYHYRVAPESRADPLGYGELGLGGGTWGTYAEWNDRSVERRHAFHNVVAGVGSYLYSSNPSIGDLTVMHAAGWNFGGNSGGHGGVHREEKLTVMLVSGPGIAPGELMAKARNASRGPRAVPARHLTHPTVLDVAPTALAWLGFGETALEDFEREDFPGHLSAWVAAQRADVLGNLDRVENLNQALREAGFGELRISRFRERLARLLAFLPTAPPPLPEPGRARTDGNLLALD